MTEKLGIEVKRPNYTEMKIAVIIKTLVLWQEFFVWNEYLGNIMCNLNGIWRGIF